MKSYQKFLNEQLIPPITELDISGQEYTECPILPETLLKFDCTDNQISDFPHGFPPQLEELYCAGNILATLPPLPTTLKSMSCCDNNLTQVPELPESIIAVFCTRNKITSLPFIPPTVTEFYCYGNPLEDVIPEKYMGFNQRETVWFEEYIDRIRSYSHQKMMAEKYGAVKLIEFKDYLHPDIRKEYPEIVGSQEFGFFD